MSAIVLCFGNDVPDIGPRVRSAFSSKWMAQQARNLLMKLDDRQRAFRFLIHDRDSKFTGDVDTIFRSEGIEIIRTPVQAPNANAHAERWVRTVRSECLDRTLVLGRRHLEYLLRVYAAHYNRHRPHRSLALSPPNETRAIAQARAAPDTRSPSVRRPRRTHPRIRTRGLR